MIVDGNVFQRTQDEKRMTTDWFTSVEAPICHRNRNIIYTYIYVYIFIYNIHLCA